MERFINILQKCLENKHIKRHIICPSVAPFIKERLSGHITEIIDERSAGYIATGMCAEANEPVVVWCANDVSFRNLAPAMTEAYYRKLPLLIIGITDCNGIEQDMNPHDILRYKFQVPFLTTEEEMASIIAETIQALNNIVLGPTLLLVNKDVMIEKDNKKFQSNTHENKDGKLSKLIGASIVDSNHVHVGYFSKIELERDINMLGNRHIQGNIIVVNRDGDEKDKVIWNFAKRMQWNCKKLSQSDLEQMIETISIECKPLYIEIMK